MGNLLPLIVDFQILPLPWWERVGVRGNIISAFPFHPPLDPLPSREGKIEEWTIVMPPAGSSFGPRIWPFLEAQGIRQGRNVKGRAKNSPMSRVQR
jgi:hypothetical protein